ncbi:MAG: hypothetical protein AAFX96_06220 [Pseudomonadota bacterium]
MSEKDDDYKTMPEVLELAEGESMVADARALWAAAQSVFDALEGDDQDAIVLGIADVEKIANDFKNRDGDEWRDLAENAGDIAERCREFLSIWQLKD